MAFKRSAVRFRLAPPTFAASRLRLASAKLRAEARRAKASAKRSRLRAAFAFWADPNRIAGRTGGHAMKGKIGLEEHFAIDDTLMDSRAFFPDDIWEEVRERILDLHGRRLRLMDEFGMRDDDPVAERARRSRPFPTPSGQRDRAQGQRLSRRAGARSAPTASRRWRRCRCRTPTSPRGSCSAA